MPIMRNALTRNRYVGMAKMLPASRRPRRLPSVIRPMAVTPITTFQSYRAGTADAICSTADVVDTATVRM